MFPRSLPSPLALDALFADDGRGVRCRWVIEKYPAFFFMAKTYFYFTLRYTRARSDYFLCIGESN